MSPGARETRVAMNGKAPATGRQRVRQRQKRPSRSAVGACTKYTLFFENFIILLVGLAATSLSAYILVLKEKQVREYYEFLLDPSCLMCAAGSVVTLMGFLGSYGALRENTCCLKTYFYLLGIFLLAELAIAILAITAYYVEDIQEKLFPKALFDKAIENYREDPDMKNLIDDLQSQLKCCGLSNDDEGYKDWNKNIFYNCSLSNVSPDKCAVPQSCCQVESGNVINHKCGGGIYLFVDGRRQDFQTANIYARGCIKALGDWIKTHALVAGGVLFGIILPQIFIGVLTRNLVDMINTQKSKW